MLGHKLKVEMDGLAKYWAKLWHIFKNSAIGRRYGFGRTISIVIEDNSVQFAVASKIIGSKRLNDVSKIYIPSTCNTSEKRQAFISEEVARYVGEHRRTFTRFILGAGGVETAVRVLSFPSMPHKELSKAVFWEGNKQIPFGLANACYGYRLVETAKSGSGSTSNICLIAVNENEIDSQIEVLKNEMRIDEVHYGLEAIGFLLRQVSGYSPDKTYVLIDIRKSHTEISFYRGIRLEFKHISSVGSGSLRGGNSDAEDYQTFTDILAREIQNSLDFYVGQFSRSTTEVAYLYGDFSYSEEISSKLTARFGIEFRIFPSSACLRSKSEKDGFCDQIPVALKAVALATVDDRMIDLAPAKMKERRSIRKFYHWAIPAITLAVIFLIAIWMEQKYRLDQDNYLLRSASGEIEDFTNSPSFIIYNKIKKRLATDAALLNKLKFDPTFLHLNLKEISLLTPETINLRSYQVENTGQKYFLNLEGSVVSSSVPPEVALAEYIARLEGSPFFTDVKLIKYLKKSEDQHFVLDFAIQSSAIL